MGLDYAEKRARSYRKGLDLKRIELGTPTLFTHQHGREPRAYAAKLHKGEVLARGQRLVVRSHRDMIVAFRGLDPVATFNNPPAELRDALAASHGIAHGIVQEIHEIATTTEITVC